MCDDINNCCRICLDVDSEHINILEDRDVELQIKTCLGIHVSHNDKLTKNVCGSCVSQLRSFYDMLLNAKSSQDWLESCIEGKSKKSDAKTVVQPLPDPEYNSDSLLEFLNSTGNIDEYINNLGKEDIPSFVNMLDRNHENSMDTVIKVINHYKPKTPSPKKKEPIIKLKKTDMKVDVLDSEFEIVKELLIKECEAKSRQPKINEKFSCFGCKSKFDNVNALSQHTLSCQTALQTCWNCGMTFDSKQKIITHMTRHGSSISATCGCGRQFTGKEKLLQHYKDCSLSINGMKCTYRCKKCGILFDDRLKLNQHVKTHKVNGEMCDICGHIFKDNIELQNHRGKTHNGVKSIKHRCKVCKFTSQSWKEVYTHVQGHLSPLPNSHLCESCGQSFSTRQLLTRHVTTHKKKNAKKNVEQIICEHCGLSVDSAGLSSHTCDGVISDTCK